MAPRRLRPFQRLPFDQLPERPWRPHLWGETVAKGVVVDSGRLGRLAVRYREFGDGPPLLLVHGLMTTGYSWRYVLDELGSEYRLVIPDLPGAGRSERPTRPLDPGALASWIGDFQRTLGIRGCPAIGNSLGGYLCMRLALDDAGAFSRLVDIHSPGLPTAKMRALATALAVPGTRPLVSWLVRRDPLRWVWRNVHYFDESLKSVEELREYGAPLETEAGVGAFLSYLTDTLRPSGFAEFARALAEKPFPVPLLLVYSRRDPLVPPSMGERLAALIPDARLEWLDASSHFAHVDTPDEVTRLVRAFLEA